MDFRVDAKGKYYTSHVSKQSLAVVARVHDSIVMGTLHLTPEHRLKDELNGEEVFVAFTDVEIWSAEAERPLYRTPLLVVNKNQLAWIFPREDAPPGSDPNDAPKPE